MFVNGIYLSVFYCLCYKMDVSKDILEDQVSEDRYPDLNEEEDIRMDTIRENHSRDVAEEVDNKKSMYTLRWDIHVKYK